MRPSALIPIALLAALSLCLGGCALVTTVGIRFLYRRAVLPESQITREVCYVGDGPCDTDKHRLDLYRPGVASWPVIVFIHGGNWDSGDKNLRVGGVDVYANIGRYFATRGIGVAVINYRLQPGVKWREQVADARKAVRWVHDHVGEFGGRADELFLMGHSAGAYLASFVALDTSDANHVPVKGVICVSGAGLDMADARTYELGEDIHYYERRFRDGDTTSRWQRIASPVTYVYPGAPPFLILYAAGEKVKLHRQAQVLANALQQAGVENRTTIVPGENHSRIVLTLSHPGKTAVPAIEEFVRGHR